jgi:hypothetical protein
LRFFPLRRFPDNGQPLNPEGYHSSGYGAFSAFLTLPRPYFRPLSAGLVSCRSRPWGFPFRAVLAPGAIHPLGLLSPLVVSSPCGLCFGCSRPPTPRISIGFFESTLGEAALRSAHPTSGFSSPATPVLPLLIMRRRTRPSWAFSSLGVSRLPSAGLPRSPSSHGLGWRLITRQLPSRVFPAGSSARLFRVSPPLPRFVAFPADPASSR